jgi:hypothetical protein
VVITFEGPFQTSDALEVLERHRTEGVWGYSALYDLRGMTGHPTNTDLRHVMKGQAVASGGPRGPVAIVATEQDLYAKACTYKALGESSLTIDVFRDQRDAELWLAANSAERS